MLLRRSFNSCYSIHQQQRLRQQCRSTNHPAVRSSSKQTSFSSKKLQRRIVANSYSDASLNNADYMLNLRIPTAEDMEDIGGILSVDTVAGDVILLDGDLGAGKTCFSRGFIRGRTGHGSDTENVRVTSPTYLLSNTYPLEEDGINIHHMDLYRLSSDGLNDLAAVLDIDNAFTNGICLVEWPSRLIEKPVTRLDITLTIDSTTLTTKTQVGDSQDDSDGDDNESIGRLMQLVPHGTRWQERLRFLESEGYFDDLLV
jgi:tRNA threonylcarbamoyladenosine biosynthesis protein TsaE